MWRKPRLLPPRRYPPHRWRPSEHSSQRRHRSRCRRSCFLHHRPFSTIGPRRCAGRELHRLSLMSLSNGHTRIGARTSSNPFAAIGVAPQDLKYKGEPTKVEIGDENTIRESVTISRGTVKGGGVTPPGLRLPADGLCAHRPRQPGRQSLPSGQRGLRSPPRRD